MVSYAGSPPPSLLASTSETMTASAVPGGQLLADAIPWRQGGGWLECDGGQGPSGIRASASADGPAARACEDVLSTGTDSVRGAIVEP